MRVALVHDYLNQMGGAERVLLIFKEMFPEAPIFTSIYDPKRVHSDFQKFEIHTSFMQKFPFIMNHHQPYLPFYPLAMESFDLRGYDLVLSSSSAFAKAVITRPETTHICYCHTPMRWAWNYSDYINRENISGIVKVFLPLIVSSLRIWDYSSASRVDHFAANSPVVASRIKKYYRRESEVIPPPIDTSLFQTSNETEDYFLILSRLIPYKRIDIAIQAAKTLGVPLKIIGAGRDYLRLKSLSGPTVEFLGKLPDEKVKEYLSKCRALIHPGEEDFGLTPLEAQASGRPVIAYGRGGVITSVTPGKTGVFFNEQTEESLINAIQRFEKINFNPQKIRQQAEKFDIKIFKQRMLQFIEASTQNKELSFAR